MMLYTVQAGRAPQFSAGWEETGIAHIPPPSFNVKSIKCLKISEAALRRLHSLSLWPCSDKENPELIFKGFLFA